MKVHILIIFCALFILKSETSADNVTCQYEDIDISIFSMKFSAYSCELSLDFENYENITQVIGEHDEAEKTDGVLKILQMFCPSKIQALSSVFCDKFNNLEALILENVEIKEIQQNSLQKCQNLKLLHLNGNEVGQIPENFLLENTNLVEIVISSNKIESLEADTFKTQKNLQKLFLHNNKIESLPGRIFRNLKNLKKLNLDDNQIEVLDAEWFDCLDNLVSLSINSNKVAHLPQNIFANLNNLQMLHMDDNLLTILNSNSFGSRDKLTQICVNSNNISAMDPEIVENSKLTKLRMENNFCFDEIIESRHQMAEKLKLCFDNFDSTLYVQDESNLDRNATADVGDILTAFASFSSQSNFTQEREDEEPTSVEPDTAIVEDLTTTSTEASSTTSTIIKEITTVAKRIAQEPLNCGKAIINDDDSLEQESYPWSAVVMKNGLGPCSGVLISEKKVVTAAKCLYKFDEKTEELIAFTKFEIVILLGIDNKNSQGKKVTYILDLFIHPDYNINAYEMDADIAVMILRENVKFNQFIQPICLTDLSVVTSEGVVVSYGQLEPVPKSTNPIQKEIVCKIFENPVCPSKNDAFSSISSNRTFCGGESKGTGLCFEDIGSGLYVKNADHFYLRGIVSAVVAAKEGVCDEDTYALFTDVSEFIKFIDDPDNFESLKLV
ncbi:unnamed protein product [Chironomus riparius]|uniref:Peptidase S1 domain-containing protein n=1 Tax=Chironomus riparius TaxID=315576 RepID=A0A9P0NNZ2_9DIPT|nr:unnamed protein product [Chironomus riparius]